MKKTDLSFFNNTEFASNLTKDYIQNIDIAKKKRDGQVFTPPEIARYMAQMINLPKNNFSLLDPGAGTGILLAAICDRIINEEKFPKKIQITAYETDNNILAHLKLTLEECKKKLLDHGHNLDYSIHNTDFIKNNIACLKNLDGEQLNQFNLYDIIIANPPYQKLSKSSELKDLLPEIVYGRTNLYGIFISIGIGLLKNNGQYVFFTPRSYFSGPYHRKVRELVLKDTCIKTIHLFESRHNIFAEHDVLQEVVILYGEKMENLKCPPININSSKNQSLSDIQTFNAPYNYIIPKKNPLLNIHIPQKEEDLKIIDVIQSWNYSFNDFGLKISTGKVVDFRIKGFLRESKEDNLSVPLLWMHHLKNDKINWPFQNFKNPQFIQFCESTKTKLVPVTNYVLLRRFSSKEENKRIQAFPFLASHFSNYQYIGFENHLNYLFRINGQLSVEEAYGFSAFFNSDILDRYYRILSGNTQVNASDLMNLPLPEHKIILEIGKIIHNKRLNPIKSKKIIEDILMNS